MPPPLTAPRRWTAHVARLAAVAGMAAADAAPAAPPAAPEVQWLLYELPPLYITQGPRQGQGSLDRALRDGLLPQLPGWQHRIVALPPKRLEANLRNLPNSCVLGIQKNAERETYLYFSQPFPIRSAPGLLVRQADLPRWRSLLDEQGRLPLTEWLRRTDTRLGHAEGRAYGATLDALVAAQPEGRVEKLTSQNPALQLMQMLDRGRIDGVLVLPFELAQLTPQAGLDPASLTLLPLVEQEPVRQGHVACARSPLGAEVVKRADALLADPQLRAAVLRAGQPPAARR